MTKKELVADMKQSVGGGGFITLSGIASYIGVKSHHSVDKYVNGLERINTISSLMLQNQCCGQEV